jgi:hypothetical protein
VGRACNENGGTTYTKESPAANSSQQEKGRKPQEKWEDGVREDVVVLLGTRAWKTEAKDKESWRQRIEEAKARFGL